MRGRLVEYTTRFVLQIADLLRDDFEFRVGDRAEHVVGLRDFTGGIHQIMSGSESADRVGGGMGRCADVGAVVPHEFVVVAHCRRAVELGPPCTVCREARRPGFDVLCAEIPDPV